MLKLAFFEYLVYKILALNAAYYLKITCLINCNATSKCHEGVCSPKKKQNIL